MKKLLRNKPAAHASLFILAALLVVLQTAAGCGGAGSDKKTTPAAAEAQATLTGKIDLFSGYGVELDSAGRAALLRKGAVAHIYRIKPDGSSLVPFPDVPTAKIDGDSFRIEKAPMKERNLIVRVETSDSKPILAAILPTLSSGDNKIMVTPETDLEAALLQKLVSVGIRKARDAKPWELDASFIKEFVDDTLFFDMTTLIDSAVAADKLLPFVSAAYGRFIDTLLGRAGVEPSDKAILKLLDSIAAPEIKLSIAGESGGADKSDVSAFEVTLAAAMKTADIKSAELAHVALWTAARRSALVWAARCIAGDATAKSCPEAVPESISPYGALLEQSLESKWSAADIAARSDAVFADSGAQTATDTPAISQLVAIKKLTGMPDNTVTAFSNALSVIESEYNSDRRTALLKRWMQDLRDMLLTSVAGMDAEAANGMKSLLVQSAKPIATALGDPSNGLAAIEAAHKSFIASQDNVFSTLDTILSTRYPKLEKTDLGKLKWAMREIITDATVFDVPSAFFAGADNDGDGAPDAEERVVGTDPNSSKSTPAPVIVSTPSSMLPEFAADSDNDGFPDIIETAAGTDPKNAAAAPMPGWMSLCGAPGDTCLAPLPESVAATNSIEGTATFLGSPALGIYAGLYTNPSFINNPPVAIASAATGDDGLFSIGGVKPGKYFLAGFSDLSNAGMPTAGDAAGYAGSPYPRRIAVTVEKIKIEEPVGVYGILGTPKCAEGQLLNPASGACVQDCPAGMEPNNLIRQCRCEKGYFSPVTAACESSCPDPFMPNRLGVCTCPPGMEIEKSADGKATGCKESKPPEPPAEPKPGAVTDGQLIPNGPGGLPALTRPETPGLSPVTNPAAGQTPGTPPIHFELPGAADKPATNK